MLDLSSLVLPFIAMARLAPLHEDAHLREAIKTTLTQICKVGVSFTSDIVIEGTIGVTVDRKKVTLIHFNEKILSTDNDVESTQPMMGLAPLTALPPNNQTLPQSRQSTPPTSQEPAQNNLRLLGAETLSSLHEYLNRSLPILPADCAKKFPIPRPPLQGYFPDTPSKLLSTLNENIAINIDSDSESFCSIQYDEAVERNDEELESKTKDLLQKNLSDVKNIIVIDDNTELFGSVNDTIDGNYSFVGPDTSMPKYGEPSGSLDLQSEFSSISSSEQLRLRMNPTSTVSEACTTDFVHSSQDVTQLLDTTVSNGMITNTTTSTSTTIDRTLPSKKDVKPGFNCEICGKRLHNLISVENHLVTTHNITESVRFGKLKYFECVTCSKKFRYQTLLDKHVRKHSQLRPYMCKICRNSYRHRESLEIHRKVHTNDYECTLCNKKYTSKVLFQKHIIYMHDRDILNIKTVKPPKR